MKPKKELLLSIMMTLTVKKSIREKIENEQVLVKDREKNVSRIIIIKGVELEFIEGKN